MYDAAPSSDPPPRPAGPSVDPDDPLARPDDPSAEASASPSPDLLDPDGPENPETPDSPGNDHHHRHHPRGIRARLAAAVARNVPYSGVAAAIPRVASRVAVEAVGAAVRARLRPADLDERDSYLVRDIMPVAWIVASLWFRAEVRGLHHIPSDRPVLLVGNHSGGNLTPDSFVFALGFSSHFGPERPLHVLVHNLVSAFPGLGVLRKLGTLPADPQAARDALAAGSCVLVYPGGDREVHRPSWDSAKIAFGGRCGFVRLALQAGVPIVPVVSIGGQETALFLGRGEGLARLLGVDRSLRLKAMPLSLGPPWGINVGDFLGHVPLPSKIVVQVLPAIDVRERFGDDPDHRAVYDHVTATMQEMLTELQSRRRLPVVG